MVVPPENPSGNKLSRKSQRKAVQRALGKQKRRKKPSAKKPSAKQPNPQPKAARRGGMPVNAPPGIEALEQVNLNAAGIDVGATVHFVAVPEGRDGETSVENMPAFDVRCFAHWSMNTFAAGRRQWPRMALHRRGLRARGAGGHAVERGPGAPEGAGDVRDRDVGLLLDLALGGHARERRRGEAVDRLYRRHPTRPGPRDHRSRV